MADLQTTYFYLTKDNYINEGSLLTNYGTGTAFYLASMYGKEDSYEKKPMLETDISALSADRVIRSAELRLYVATLTKDALDDMTDAMKAFDMMVAANNDWVEAEAIYYYKYIHTQGTATGGTDTTLEHTGAGWTPDEWIGKRCVLTGGTGVGEYADITDNDEDTLTVDFTTTPDATTGYVIGEKWGGSCGPSTPIQNGPTSTGWYSYIVGSLAAYARRVNSGIFFPNLLTINFAVGLTDRELVIASDESVAAATGTAESGTANTLTDDDAAWAVNAFANLTVEITGGTGSGQIRRIASNTATVLTVTEDWDTNPDDTSVFDVEWRPHLEVVHEPRGRQVFM